MVRSRSAKLYHGLTFCSYLTSKWLMTQAEQGLRGRRLVMPAASRPSPVHQLDVKVRSSRDKHSCRKLSVTVTPFFSIDVWWPLRYVAKWSAQYLGLKWVLLNTAICSSLLEEGTVRSSRISTVGERGSPVCYLTVAQS